jgi:hypothetical protein
MLLLAQPLTALLCIPFTYIHPVSATTVPAHPFTSFLCFYATSDALHVLVYNSYLLSPECQRALPTPLPCTQSPCASSPSALCEFRLWSACPHIVATGYEPQWLNTAGSTPSVIACHCQCPGLHTVLLPIMSTTSCLHLVDALPSADNANFLLLLASGLWCFAPGWQC